MVQPESEFVQILGHVLRRHADMGGADRNLELTPEVFDPVGRDRLPSRQIETLPFLG